MSKTIEEMGLGWAWIGAAYKSVHDAARKVNDNGPANTALKHLAAMVREEQEEEAAQIAPPPRIDIDALGAVLGKVSGLVEASKGTANAVPTMPEVKAIRASEADD